MMGLDAKQLTVINELAENNQEFRKVLFDHLGQEIDRRRSELAEYEATRSAFLNGDLPKTLKKTATSGKKRGRPAGATGGHKEAILSVLRSSKNGLSYRDIMEGLEKMGHNTDSKIIQTYLSKMKLGNILESDNGEEGLLTYKIVQE